MGFLGTQSFGFGGGGGGSTPPATPTWQAVTDVGSTTTDDIFVIDGFSQNYLQVDKASNIYFLGDGNSGRGIYIDATAQNYIFGPSGLGDININLNGVGTPSMTFNGTTLYQFNDSIADYASGAYQAVVLHTTGIPSLQIQPKDMVPEQTVTADYTATVDDCIINVNTTGASAPINITLPDSSSGILPGKRFFIKWGTGTFDVNVYTTSGDLDGAGGYTLPVVNTSIEVVWDGINYWIL